MELQGMLGHKDGKPCFWMPIRVSRDTSSLNSSLSLFLSFLFLLSGGSECSGLHVLSRCVGIEENTSVKRKGAQNPPHSPGNSATGVSIYVWEPQERKDVFAYTGVCVREKGIFTLHECVWAFLCFYVCVLLKHVYFVGVVCMFVFLLGWWVSVWIFAVYHWAPALVIMSDRNLYLYMFMWSSVLMYIKYVLIHTCLCKSIIFFVCTLYKCSLHKLYMCVCSIFPVFFISCL